MARDLALLDLAADRRSAAVRTYGWSQPTLSLGYFQNSAEVARDPRWRGAAIVRRPTGGGAIWHDIEVTYSVALNCDHPFARRVGALYQAIHVAIASMLNDHGMKAHLRGVVDGVREGKRPFLCFLDRDRADIVMDGYKIVGSAQRRRLGALLQHGSLLLGRSPRTPELPGVHDLADATQDPTYWATLLEDCLVRTLELEPCEGEWTSELNAHVHATEKSVFRDRAWTHRR
jgi:lipoate-protein ligase A